MSETYYLQDEITRIEDLINTGLVSGDTIELSGKILTCESDTVAAGITGLLATGTGTIRMLNGGNVDFSGSNPLPNTITIEGGTEENPLPSYGNYGYVGRASAFLKLANNINFSGKIISHCNNYLKRIQYATILSRTANSITLDSEVDWNTGDTLAWTYFGNMQRNHIIVNSYDNETHTIFHSTGYTPDINTPLILVSASFVIGGNTNIKLSGQILGDDLGVQCGDNTYIINGFININRFTKIGLNIYNESHAIVGNYGYGKIGILCTMGTVVGITSGNQQPPYYDIGYLIIKKCYAAGVCRWYNNPYLSNTKLKIYGGWLYKQDIPYGSIGRIEYTNTKLPPNAFDNNYAKITNFSECIVKNTDDLLCKIIRKNGIATLKQKSNFPSPTEIPEAWQLEPNNSSCYAWHDEERIVDPGRTLVAKWYCFIGDETTESAGIQILDGEFPGFGQVAVEMNLADVLTEYTLPIDTPVMQWLPVKQITWTNNSDRPKKIVLRGWCKGGEIYSRIGFAQGGVI